MDLCAGDYAVISYALCLAFGVSCNIYTDVDKGLVTVNGIVEEVKR
jgi:hypothetical protein